MKPLAVGLAGLWLSIPRLAADDLLPLVAQAWEVAEQRCEATVAWLTANPGSLGLHTTYPSVGIPTEGTWMTISNTRDWRNGFWPGTLWLLAQRTGSATWRQRAADWSAPLAASTNSDHDIGFIVLPSIGMGRLFHDDLTDPGGAYRASAKSAILTGATKLDSRFNQPNSAGTPVPANFTRSWDNFQDPYPVCVDNLINLEILLLAYELNGRMPADRHWFDHALIHARTSIARHMRADGGTYHVVKHFESGSQIGKIERKSTLQGYGDETTWSRGQAWAIHGLTTVFRYARQDPGTDATDILAAAQAAADYFIDRLPHHYTADSYNHRPGDFVPPSDFDAALGEPSGPWNDANNNYNSSTRTGLGDRRPAMNSFTFRDSSAAAVAAAGLIDLSGQVSLESDRARYLGAAEDILRCLITYDGDDPGTAPDYLCAVGETAHPGILKAGSVRWGESIRSLIYGDYYFLQALARYEALRARELLAESQLGRSAGDGMEIEFEITAPAPGLTFHIQKSSDLTPESWATIATRTGVGSWSGGTTVTEESISDSRTRVKIIDASPGPRRFFRILTRSLGRDGS